MRLYLKYNMHEAVWGVDVLSFSFTHRNQLMKIIFISKGRIYLLSANIGGGMPMGRHYHLPRAI
jgi:hypothetical protein